MPVHMYMCAMVNHQRIHWTDANFLLSLFLPISWKSIPAEVQTSQFLKLIFGNHRKLFSQFQWTMLNENVCTFESKNILNNDYSWIDVFFVTRWRCSHWHMLFWHILTFPFPFQTSYQHAERMEREKRDERKRKEEEKKIRSRNWSMTATHFRCSSVVVHSRRYSSRSIVRIDNKQNY